MSKNARQLIILVCIVVFGGAFLWYFEYGPSTRPIASVKAAEVAGRGFTISVPNGFEVVKDDRMKAMLEGGGVALAAGWRAGPGRGFRPSIAVIPLPSAWSGGDPGNEATCAQVTKDATATTPTMNVVRREVIRAPWGATCQWEIVDKEDPARGAVGTFVAKGTGGWVITCNLSPADDRARTACREVVSSWKFSDR
jgi:hypothetical protein